MALFEKQAFPRFQIGESLVPACNLTLEKLGVIGAMDELGFTQKHGVQFFSDGKSSKPFYFRDVADPRMHYTWQVLRSEFDSMLLDNARNSGVDARTECQVTGIREVNGAVAGVQIRTAGGRVEDVTARIVVDATGQNGVVARRFGGRSVIEGLRNASVFAHYRDVRRDEGVDAGSTLIYHIGDRSWIWFIPLRDSVSVGLVTPAAELSGSSPEVMLDDAIGRCPQLRERLSAATRLTEVRAARDFSYRAANDGGRGWLLVGDALGFIDPIYSTGLFLTMHSAEIAANAVIAALAGDESTLDFAGYSREYQTAFDQFLTLVRAFYDEAFHFRALTSQPNLRRGLTDLLTGVVGTAHAREVTDSIETFLSGRVKSWLGPPGQR